MPWRGCGGTSSNFFLKEISYPITVNIQIQLLLPPTEILCSIHHDPKSYMDSREDTS